MAYNETNVIEQTGEGQWHGGHKILVRQWSQNKNENTSDVRVYGSLHNYNDWLVEHRTADIGRHISGEGGHYPDPFWFSIPGHDAADYITHTFTVRHDDDGRKTVRFTCWYGPTDTPTFGGNQSVTGELVLDRIPRPPLPPGQPQFSNIMSTSVTISWTAADGNGATVDNYRLRRWTGSSQSGSYVDSEANNLTRNLTNLVPGQAYTFAVYAHNSRGWSSASADSHLGMVGGGWIRVGDTWKAGIPYVRNGGIWKMATPYVRSGGIWKPAE